MTVIYDNAFNLNELFVIGAIIVTGILIWKLPKPFSTIETIAYILFGIVYGMFFDHTISVKPWDFYDVNDTSDYQLMDFLSYVMYGPFSYFFVYFYKKLKIKGFQHLLYVLIWSTFSIFMGWIGTKIGLFHFNKGYSMYWSFPIYLFVQSLLIVFYQIVCVKDIKKVQNDC